MSHEPKIKISWPSPQDYSEAVQTPRLSFDDHELASATVACNKLGLPICMSGNFASVFCFNCAGRKVAVRCFLHTITDESARYDAISRAMNAEDLTCTVPCQYLEKGVRINGSWYPILKMDWVSGISLHKFVEDTLDNPLALNLLAGYFKQSLVDLNKAGIAHGDLQHDNIMVSKSELRLVDYDGMYVPSLAGSQAKELGHPNYQHPNRSSNHYGPYLDNFSAWLIFCSLRILSVDSSLYQRFDGGADCILFRHADLADPNHSELFRALESHDEQEVRWFTYALRRFISLEVEQVPALKVPLQEIVDNVIVLPTGTRKEPPDESPETASEKQPINRSAVAWIEEAKKAEEAAQAAALTPSVIAMEAAAAQARAKPQLKARALAQLRAEAQQKAQAQVQKLTAIRIPKRHALNLPTQNPSLSGFQRASAPKHPISVRPLRLDANQAPMKTIMDLLLPGEFIRWSSTPPNWRQTNYLLAIPCIIPCVFLMFTMFGTQVTLMLVCLCLLLHTLHELKDSQGSFVTNRRLVVCDRRLIGSVITSVELASIENAYYSNLDLSVHVRARKRWIGPETRNIRVQGLSKRNREALLHILRPATP